MKHRSSLLGLAVVVGLGLASSACGDDSPYVQKDAGPDPVVTFTSYVIDLVNNHTNDPAPAAYVDFKDLPDPDGDTNNPAAYTSLFP